MKMHIGVDETFGLIHSVATTPANVSDITVADQLLHGDEKTVWGDAGYTGIEKREEHKDRPVGWKVAMRLGRRAQLPRNSLLHEVERMKASIRAKVEHPFLTIKQIFGYSKVRYRGLQKNHNRLIVLAAFTNLLRARPYLAT
jgi:IS5 family transposase